MRFLIAIFMAVLSLSTVTSAKADDFKVAIIDIQRLQGEAKAAVDIRNQVEALRKTYIATLEKEEAALRKEEKALVDNKATMKEDEFRKKAEAFRTELVSKSKAMQEKQAYLDKAVGDALTKLRDEIIKITDEVSKEKAYTLVLTRQSVFYFDKSYNITDDVLKKLDARVKSIKINAK
jgi:Skp family chaperone for outer membrane proteins